MSSQNKDNSRFELVYAANKDLIFRTAKKYSDNNDSVAQEITQEVFLQLYIHFDTFEEDYLTAWLVTTAKNTAKNYMKKAARENPDANIALTAELCPENKTESAEEIVFGRMKRNENIRQGSTILEALYDKNERWYEAVTMVYCMEKKQADVAVEMGISIEVLHSVLYRAKQWIKKYYQSNEHTP